MRGEDLHGTFVDKRIKSSVQKIHNPIKREKIQLFKNTGKTVVVKSENKKLVVEVNRNILGKLLAFSTKTGRQIDFERALTYPLSPMPLSLANPDGSCQKQVYGNNTILLQHLYRSKRCMYSKGGDFCLPS